MLYGGRGAGGGLTLLAWVCPHTHTHAHTPWHAPKPSVSSSYYPESPPVCPHPHPSGGLPALLMGDLNWTDPVPRGKAWDGEVPLPRGPDLKPTWFDAWRQGKRRVPSDSDGFTYDAVGGEGAGEGGARCARLRALRFSRPRPRTRKGPNLPPPPHCTHTTTPPPCCMRTPEGQPDVGGVPALPVRPHPGVPRAPVPRPGAHRRDGGHGASAGTGARVREPLYGRQQRQASAALGSLRLTGGGSVCGWGPPRLPCSRRWARPGWGWNQWRWVCRRQCRRCRRRGQQRSYRKRGQLCGWQRGRQWAQRGRP